MTKVLKSHPVADDHHSVFLRLCTLQQQLLLWQWLHFSVVDAPAAVVDAPAAVVDAPAAVVDAPAALSGRVWN